MKTTVFFKNHWQEIAFNCLIILFFILFYGRFGDINVDSFREAYIPAQMLDGRLLYKDIFTIYAPLSYLFNSLLFAIFGINLKVLYFSGLITTLGISNFAYKIANIFLEKNYSFAIIVFFIATAMLSPNVFNTIFPYSYGILYGLFFILLSIYFGLKEHFPLMYLFYSLAICTKYEFVFLLPLLAFISRNQNLVKNLLALFLPPLICILILFIQGISLNDILTSIQIVLVILSTNTLKWFYSSMGYIFRIEHIPLYFTNFIKICIPIAILSYFKQKWIIPLVGLYLFIIHTPASFIYLFPLIVVLFFVRYKNLNNKEKMFVISSLLISLKVFFALTLQAYGVFFILFAFISLLILIPKPIQKATFTTILLSALIYCIQNTKYLSQKSIILQTNRGVIKTNAFYGNSYNQLLEYVNKYTNKDNKIVVYPEGLVVNFLANRKSDDKFYSLIPLYTETFGEELIIKRLELIKPEYIVITEYDTSNYYYKTFGYDYARRIKGFVENKYTLIFNNTENLPFLIYKIK